MKSNPLIQLLAVFSRKEVTRFKDFVYSPYHNKHRGVRLLVGHLSQIYPNFTEKSCTREGLFQILFPDEGHDQAKLATVFTYALRLAEQFLITEQFREREGLHRVLLLQNLRQKEQNRYYQKVLKTQSRWLEGQTYRDGAHFNRRFLLLAEADLFFSEQARYSKGGSIQRKQDSLDHFYLSEKLKDACEMQVRRRIMQQEYQNPLFEALLAEVAANPSQYAAVPPVVVYFQLYQMIRHGADADYRRALEVIREKAPFFPKRELQNLYNYLQNHCIQQINQGHRHFLKEIFELYKFQLEDDLLFINGYLPEWHYKNIVSTGLLLHETAWVRDFIEGYKKHLPPDVVDNAYSYNLAFYYYETQQYGRVLDLLVHLEYSDLRYALNAKLLLLKTYYDLDEYETLLSLSDSFRQYLQRKKEISDFNRQGYYQLLRFTRRAIQIKMKVGYVARERLRGELQKLRAEIETTNTRFGQAWLESKLREIEGMVA
ncbi:MAG: hypothetical protein AAFW73_18750 [Bacteroidota bacterium]